MKLRYPVLFISDIDEDEVTLNYEERCAVRYTAGYTIQSLLKKVKCSRNKQKELKKCLQDMIESTEESLHDSISWTKAVDRGGLIHVNDYVFDVFAEMEIVLRKNLKACKQDLRQVVEVIVNDDNVLFTCALVSASWQEEQSVALLRLIAQHWVTMRGFSNAKSLLEQYKRRSKQSVQKSKGLRRKLSTTTS